MKKFKFSSINKRHLTLAGLIVVVAVAGYANINYKPQIEETVETISSNVSEIQPESPVEDDYTIAVMERDEKRSKSMQVYRDIINNSNCDKQTKENAQNMLSASAEFINDENTIEKSLSAKGVEKSVAYIDKDGATIIVYNKKLDEVLVSQIKDIVVGESGLTADKIKIIENK